MIDENAFGVLISYFEIENDEYSLEAAAFATRWQEFRAAWQECLGIWPLGSGARAIDLGHALYLEICEGEQSEDPIVWLKMVRARIAEKGFPTVGVVTYGGRWVEETPLEAVHELGGFSVLTVTRPSEPLRFALYADTAARVDEESPGWGAGLFAQDEALEALGKKLKNEPTPLTVAGSTFYRVAR
jgi:hypothetical protein